MARVISLTDDKQRDAQVALETTRPGVGHRLVGPGSEEVRLERLVYRSLREAISMASTKEGERAALLREQFKDYKLPTA